MASVAGSIPVASPIKTKRDSITVIHQSHKLGSKAGSTPTPATNIIGRFGHVAETTRPDQSSRFGAATHSPAAQVEKNQVDVAQSVEHRFRNDAATGVRFPASAPFWDSSVAEQWFGKPPIRVRFSISDPISRVSSSGRAFVFQTEDAVSITAIRFHSWGLSSFRRAPHLQCGGGRGRADRFHQLWH